jgi:hypothetical protein
MEDGMTEVSISTPHHSLKGYFAKPQGEGPWPAVIVLHDIFGLTDVTQRRDFLGGVPTLSALLKHRFYDTTLNVNVGYAKHAISIDENRKGACRLGAYGRETEQTG